MLKTVVNIFKIEDLRNKVLFTIALLLIYRLGFHIYIPGFDPQAIAKAAGARDESCRFSQAATSITARCSAWALCLISLRQLY
jgi:preprotein translocase subunit SecY